MSRSFYDKYDSSIVLRNFSLARVSNEKGKERNMDEYKAEESCKLKMG